MSVLAAFVGGPLDGQERVLPNLVSPYMVRTPRHLLEWSLMHPTIESYDEHRYDLDSRDYEARAEEIDQGAPVLFVYAATDSRSAAVDSMISFEEAYRRVNELLNATNRIEDPPHHRGEVPCFACGAEWNFQTLSMVHAPDCSFIQQEQDWHIADWMAQQAGVPEASRAIIDFIHHTPELHRAQDCDELPTHERCWTLDSGDPIMATFADNHPYDPNEYGTPWSDEAGGVSAEDLVPGIEQALREWNQTKEEIEDGD